MPLRATVKSDFRAADELRRKAPKAFRKAGLITLRRVGALVVKRAKLNLRAGEFPSIVGPTLINTVEFKVNESKMSVLIGPALTPKSSLHGDPASYGLAVEKGRKPGRAPPPAALSLFVKRRLSVGAEEFSSARYLLGQSIAKEGVKAKPWLEPALDATAKDFGKILRQEVDRAITKLG
jgi:hypothetical protein